MSQAHRGEVATFEQLTLDLDAAEPDNEELTFGQWVRRLPEGTPWSPPFETREQ
jgi:hypothetical protein